jgi:hypothetical protein
VRGKWFWVGVGALLILLTVLVYESWAGQVPGPRAPDDPDQLEWTTADHVWALVHQFADAFIPVLALAIAGGAGAVWHRKQGSS